jgi:hypothetical protein
MIRRSRRSLVPAACLVAVLASSCSKNNTPPPTTTPSCSFSVVQPTTTFGPEGGTSSAAVTAGSGCAWTATSSASFVTITQGASGSGNGTVTFSVAVNTGAERTGALTIAGTAVTITERAAAPSPPPPPPTLSAPSAKSPIGGQAIEPGRPTLVVNNSTVTGNAGAVTYRFEVSDLSSFPPDPVRTFTQDGVAQGTGGTTSWTLTRDLGANVLWYWHARATNGTVTSAFSDVETFSTGSPCSFVLSATSVTVNGAGGTVSLTVTTGSACAWSAVSNDSFITINTGASGTGSGGVTFTVAGSAGTARTGTLTVAGQTVTVTQGAGGGLVAAFQLLDPASQPGGTTECRIRSATGAPITCTLQSTSFPTGTNFIVSQAWSVQYTYETVKTLAGTASSLSFTDVCGKLTSTDDGVAQPLQVTLTVTDNLGATATATSGTGSQPELRIRLYTCGS